MSEATAVSEAKVAASVAESPAADPGAANIAAAPKEALLVAVSAVRWEAVVLASAAQASAA